MWGCGVLVLVWRYRFAVDYATGICVALAAVRCGRHLQIVAEWCICYFSISSVTGTSRLLSHVSCACHSVLLEAKADVNAKNENGVHHHTLSPRAQCRPLCDVVLVWRDDGLLVC